MDWWILTVVDNCGWTCKTTDVSGNVFCHQQFCSCWVQLELEGLTSWVPYLITLLNSKNIIHFECFMAPKKKQTRKTCNRYFSYCCWLHSRFFLKPVSGFGFPTSSKWCFLLVFLTSCVSACWRVHGHANCSRLSATYLPSRSDHAFCSLTAFCMRANF